MAGENDTPTQAELMTSHHVYVKSKEYSWLPARLVEVNDTEATVQLFEHQNEQEIGYGRRQKTSHHVVKLDDYPNRALPLQNTNADGVLQQVQDMVDLPFLHEVRKEGSLFVAFERVIF